MTKVGIAFFGLLLFFAALTPSLAAAAPDMPPASDVAAPSLLTRPIAEQLGQQLQSIVATPAPAASDTDEANQEPPPTFGTRALNAVINITEILRTQVMGVATDFAALPGISDWVAAQENDPRLEARWQTIGHDMLWNAGIALLAAIAIELLLFPGRRSLRKRSPHSIGARLAVVFSLLLLRAVSIICFVAIAVTLLNQNETQKLPRFLVMNLVYALALARIVVTLLRGILSPRSDTLRFVPATTAQAVYGFRWLSAFSLVIIFGYFCGVAAYAVHVPAEAVAAFINMLGLILVAMSIVVIVQKRAFVAQLLRGNLSAAQHDLSWFDSLRLLLARHWHTMAIAYLVIGYAIAATGIQDGLIIMLRGTLLTLLALVAARLLLREIGLWETRSKKGSTTFYTLIKGAIFRLVVVTLAIGGILSAWGANILGLASSPFGHRVLGGAFSIGTTLFILGLIYEFFSAAVDRTLAATTPDGKPVEINARSRTLLPMMRNALFVVCIVIVGVVMLSEAGINIGPLLAGAGVLGVAVGFGSQALVKDFLTGLFIVLENTVAVGDVIQTGTHSGVVETLSMRTLRLRDSDGGLHILPFSEVTQIINMTRGHAHAVIKVNVSTDTDLDRALDCFRTVGAEMQQDADCNSSILDPVEIWGVDSINDSSITLTGRVRTLPGRQWDVKRKFLLRLKKAFDREGISLASTTVIQVLPNK